MESADRVVTVAHQALARSERGAGATSWAEAMPAAARSGSNSKEIRMAAS
jgi:hypothetical protein